MKKEELEAELLKTKAAAYDCAAMSENAQMQLRQLNIKIVEISKQINGEQVNGEFGQKVDGPPGV